MSKKIGKGITKKLILEVIQTTDDMEIDAKTGKPTGKPCVRTSIPKDHYRGYVELQEKIIYTVEVALVKFSDIKDPNVAIPPDLIVWETFTKNFKTPEGQKIVGERHTDTSIDISDAAVKALRYFYKTRDELPIYPIEAIDELEELVRC